VDPSLTGLEVVLARDGGCGRLTLSRDWSATALGPMAGWPVSLRTAVGIIASSPLPMMIGWGPDLVQVYNDAFRPIFGEKHPAALGRTTRENWAEVWDFVDPMVNGALERGESTRSDDQRLLVDRGMGPEEAFFTFSFSPIWDEQDEVGGLFCAAIETTERVVGERRGATLSRLAGQGRGLTTLEEVATGVSAVIADNFDDVPLALLYLLSQDGRQAQLVGATGVDADGRDAAGRAGVARDMWRLAEVAASGVPVTTFDLPGELAARCSAAVVTTLTDPSRTDPVGMLVLGVNALRPLDDGYHDFLVQVAGHVGTALTAARAHQAERDRLEALAALDLAKTEFFNNVSHEFRTPLTLLLGPLKEALSDGVEGLGEVQRQRVDTASRNAQRLLKLVNTLLDVSRAEAGRGHASFEPTDLAELTAELVSGFDSAVARAGLTLVVDCPTLPERVFVDPEMWEKIVLNLVSNALKFTFEGTISVSVRAQAGHVELRVCDTGTGIPEDEMPNLFTRFHRVRGARARTHEGSGIGLALTRDLVTLHGGDIHAQSTAGVGSTFTVTLPLGRAHLPAEQVRTGDGPGRAALSVATFVTEALQTAPEPLALSLPTDAATRILVAEDNADMRAYLERLLSPSWTVEVAPHGAAALASALASPPDLVLSDVMMPELDGLGLLRALREHPQTQQVPVLMLSAQAGDEACEQVLQAGADDYLIKPFTQRQLLARVRLHLSLARTRQEVAAAALHAVQEGSARREAARFASLAGATTDFVSLTDAQGVVVYINPGGRRMLGVAESQDLSGLTLSDFLHPEARGRFLAQAIPTALRDGVWRGETPLRHKDGHTVPTSHVLVAHRDPEGEIAFYATIARDMTDERRASERLREAEGRFRHAFEDAPVGMAILDGSLAVTQANPALGVLLRQPPDELVSTSLVSLVHPDHRENTTRLLTQLAHGESSSLIWEVSMTRADGAAVQVTLAASLTLPRNNQRQILLHVLDITERHHFESQLRYLADHDPLTGLLNRRRLMEQLDREVAAVHRYGGTGALLLLDLDDFKYVNDSLGHAAGDELIMRTTHQLAQRLRETDTLARLGGDEFAVILPHVDETRAREVAADMLATLYDGDMIVSSTGARRLTASIGIAIYDQHRTSMPTSEELLLEADTAMYDAKEAGRAQIAAFDPNNARQAGMEVRLDAAERLREALAAGRLVLYAQPIVNVQHQDIPHYELLVRIRAEDGTIIPPGSFLDVAERFQLVGAIDRWVISEALRLLTAVSLQGNRVSLSINLSVQSILDPDLPDWIARSIASSGVDGHDLVFEVTETDAAVNFERANQLTRRLAELDCGFALDDFGTGYCSLRYLKHLSFDYLKIDAEFIRNVITSPADQLIVRAALDIAHGLGKRTVAEGVEDGKTLALLISYGIDYVQGFYLAQPEPAGDLLLNATNSRIPDARCPQQHVPGAL
jgi:diguanylate cyclase (GGDEF)-like protein/PAS domain S-box-containing protein